MAAIEGVSFRSLVESDLAGAVGLSAEAGWNQTAQDWGLMLQQGAGIGVEAEDGRLVASAMTLPYGGRFAWIAMVLVTKSWRRRGIATELLRQCIDLIEAQGLIPGLDATEAGRLVYQPLGFEDIYALSRFRTERATAPAAPGAGVRQIAPGDLDALVAYDARSFGAERPRVLAHLLARCPETAFLAETDGAIRGFIFVREGRTAQHLAPLITEDEATAIALAGAALARADGPVLTDVADHHTELAAWLARAGFARERGYMRMLRGRSEPLDDPARVFVICGPELG